MAEYVCLDGRMSVNGICPASSYPGYQDPDENIVTPPITNVNQNDGGGGDNKLGGGKFSNLDLDDFKTFDKEVYSIDMSAPGEKVTASFKPEKVTGYKNLSTGNYQTFEGKNIDHAGIPVAPLAAKVLGLDNLSQQKKKGLDLDYQLGSTKGTLTDFFSKDKTKDFSKDVKSTFEWDFDKVGNKVANFGTTVKGNISAYDDYVEENFGISKNVSNVFRAGAVVQGAATYGIAGALVPFAIPFMAGGALNNKQKKENERITQATMKDPQGGDNTIDMTTYGIPTYGDVGFNIHNDAGDKGNSGGNNYGGATQGGGFDAGGFEQDGTGRQGY